MTPRHLTAVDLFSGCGGLSLGLKRARINVLAAVESDPLAASAYRRNHPEVLLIDHDIRRVSGQLIMRGCGLKPGDLDVLAGCPPCQGFSTMTRKNKPSHAKDERNDLVFEMLRLVRELRPKTVLLENVPGLIDHWRFKRVITGLRRMGYSYDYGTLNAVNFRVPQRRKRLILVASRLGELELPKGTSAKVTVRDAIGGLRAPRYSKDPLHKYQSKHRPEVKGIIRSIPKDGGSRASLEARQQLDCHKRMDGFRDVYGRMRWNTPSPTITGSCYNPSKGRFLHPEQMRAISLREASILQTFPKGYKFPSPYTSSRSGIALLIGNALPPRFATAQANHLRRHLLALQSSR